MVDLQEVGWGFYKAIAEEGVSFLGLGDVGFLQVCMGMCTAVCKWDKNCLGDEHSQTFLEYVKMVNF